MGSPVLQAGRGRWAAQPASGGQGGPRLQLMRPGWPMRTGQGPVRGQLGCGAESGAWQVWVWGEAAGWGLLPHGGHVGAEQRLGAPRASVGEDLSLGTPQPPRRREPLPPGGEPGTVGAPWLPSLSSDCGRHGGLDGDPRSWASSCCPDTSVSVCLCFFGNSAVCVCAVLTRGADA